MWNLTGHRYVLDGQPTRKAIQVKTRLSLLCLWHSHKQEISPQTVRTAPTGLGERWVQVSLLTSYGSWEAGTQMVPKTQPTLSHSQSQIKDFLGQRMLLNMK